MVRRDLARSTLESSRPRIDRSKPRRRPDTSADLRFRIDVIRIDVPPLRGRPEDIGELAAHFWQQAAARVGSRAILGREALAALARYEWPGTSRTAERDGGDGRLAPRRGTLGVTALPAGSVARR